jgi:hypothetical protein
MFDAEMLDDCVTSAVLMKIKVFCDVTLCHRGIVLYDSNDGSPTAFNYRVKQSKKNLRRLNGFFIFGSYKYS